MPPKFFSTILHPSHSFFRTAILQKLFDTRFSYKHCNFSHVCLLVKMASKTVTRSIEVPMYSDRGCMKLSVSKIKRIVYNGPNDVGVGGEWL